MRKALLVMALTATATIGATAPAAAQMVAAAPAGGTISVSPASIDSTLSISAPVKTQQISALGVSASAAMSGQPGRATASGVRIRTRPSTSATIVGLLSQWEGVWINCYRDPGDGYRWYSLKRGMWPGPSTGWSRWDNISVGDGSTYYLPRC